MLGLYVTVPIACWRKGHAREYLETEELPPPATCYGFLLSLVGEEDRSRHVGARVTAGMISNGGISKVLRKIWRTKDKKLGRGNGENAKPEFQELVTNSRLNVWVDSRSEAGPGPTLEERVIAALTHPERIDRFGGLCLGESTHLVNEVSLLGVSAEAADTFLLDPRGRVSLPVWVDYMGSAGTHRVVGNLAWVTAPGVDLIPEICPRPS